MPSYPLASFNPPSPLQIQAGSNQVIQAQTGLYVIRWTRADGQGLPSGVSQTSYGLEINDARPDHSGVYHLHLQATDGSSHTVSYEIVVRGSSSGATASGGKSKDISKL